MGMRAQVKIKDTGVYLYTHWGSERLPEVVREALGKKWRWYDPEYLARIIFEEMIKAEGGLGEETGFGIGTEAHTDLEYPPIVIDCDNQTVTLNLHGSSGVYSFKEYAEQMNYDLKI